MITKSRDASHEDHSWYQFLVNTSSFMAQLYFSGTFETFFARVVLGPIPAWMYRTRSLKVDSPGSRPIRIFHPSDAGCIRMEMCFGCVIVVNAFF